ncbi:hypothetical protein SAMN05444156_2845 [Verrucomicrobium sp. GAS474]|uniref:hypothetical protein n=1 Tax=Verrucomicrobium sp. GAS474 TaxID=1882831 RepID=UPI00087B12E8|nr:hypothetical protein [Verrucomicrobium sp. GAS474]SDU24798.1 hypothetical protein SAMN05444156_2845 [Verrucomicrobium sp. GAS474]
MFKILTETKLPPMINKVVVVAGLLGMLVGLLLCYTNRESLPYSLLFAALFGCFAAAGVKFVIVKFIRAWMEGKLEQAANEREEAKRKAEELMKEDKKDEQKKA